MPLNKGVNMDDPFMELRTAIDDFKVALRETQPFKWLLAQVEKRPFILLVWSWVAGLIIIWVMYCTLAEMMGWWPIG